MLVVERQRAVPAWRSEGVTSCQERIGRGVLHVRTISIVRATGVEIVRQRQTPTLRRAVREA